MTATGARDGDHLDYADIADAMRDLSFSPKSDQLGLFDRATASVALGNTDDHLRNHGFLAERGMWAMSPAFDVNPNPDVTRPRATSIMGAVRLEDEVDGLLALAKECGLTLERARDRMAEIAAGLSTWQMQARTNRIVDSEIAMMAEAIVPRLRAVAGG